MILSSKLEMDGGQGDQDEEMISSAGRRRGTGERRGRGGATRIGEGKKGGGGGWTCWRFDRTGRCLALVKSS